MYPQGLDLCFKSLKTEGNTNYESKEGCLKIFRQPFLININL